MVAPELGGDRGPPVREPERRGFGTRLITECVENDLEGRVSLDYAKSGLSCVIEFPMQEATDA